MLILDLHSSDFRNIARGRLEFSPGVNLVIGGNGEGKTNLLEALYLFRFGRTFRTPVETETIAFGREVCRVEVSCRYDSGFEESFSYALHASGRKRVSVGGKPLERLSELVGRYPCVLFGPHDIQIVSGFPAERRRFLDMVGSMGRKSYLEALKCYRRVLAQRNAALKVHAPDEEMDAWDEEISRAGGELVLEREAVVAELGSVLGRTAAAHFSGEGFGIRYARSFGRDEEPAGALLRELRSARPEERRRGTTLRGPHRDDLALLVSGRDARRYASQGQKRLLALLLRFSEKSYLERRLSERCVLLLDDLFSELDRANAKKVMELLRDSNQVFLTSPRPVGEEAGDKIAVYRVSAGRVLLESIEK